MWSDLTFKLEQKTFVFKSIFLLSMLMSETLANVDSSNSGDILCEDGKTFGQGVIRQVKSNIFVLDCNVGLELSSNDNEEMRCRDGVVVVEESPECLPPFSPTFRKIRSTDSKSAKVDVPDKEKRRRHNDESVRRLNRRKNRRNRKNPKHVFQADEGAASVAGEAVQWRSYGNDVVGKNNLILFL
jgi:hypothetical protein